jgi:hypothetical protein
MEKPLVKFYLILLFLSSAAWFGSLILKNVEINKLLQFGTVEFSSSLTPETERISYGAFAEYSIVTLVSYPVVVASSILFIVSTRRSLKEDGWLLMSVVLFFIFVPLELYCFRHDWKIIGLTYWGTWPLEEFRKAFLQRLTLMAGLPFVAMLCYFTIPILVIFKPLRKQ